MIASRPSVEPDRQCEAAAPETRGRVAHHSWWGQTHGISSCDGEREQYQRGNIGIRSRAKKVGSLLLFVLVGQVEHPDALGVLDRARSGDAQQAMRRLLDSLCRFLDSLELGYELLVQVVAVAKEQLYVAENRRKGTVDLMVDRHGRFGDPGQLLFLESFFSERGRDSVRCAAGNIVERQRCGHGLKELIFRYDGSLTLLKTDHGSENALAVAEGERERMTGMQIRFRIFPSTLPV